MALDARQSMARMTERNEDLCNRKDDEAQKLPNTDSIEELARFWDTHDLTDFKGQ
jgi:hypothetical protein